MDHWAQGIKDFNEGRYWHAHEAWEAGWKDLSGVAKVHVQAMIQVAGVYVLLEKGRARGALSLAEAALCKLDAVKESVRASRELDDLLRLPQIPGSDVALVEVVRALRAGASCEDVLAVILQSRLKAGGG